MSLAFFILLPRPVIAQGSCDVDGISVEFPAQRTGALVLQDAKVKDITGRNNQADIEIAINSAGPQIGSISGGVVNVDTLAVSNFPGSGIPQAELDRTEQNAWEVNFPRGQFEFNNKSDLEVEIIVTVAGGQAAHINGNSSVTITVDEGMIHDIWWGGTNSLRRLWGSLVFTYSDFQNLGLSGTYRAAINVCVNVRGHI